MIRMCIKHSLIFIFLIPFFFLEVAHTQDAEIKDDNSKILSGFVQLVANPTKYGISQTNSDPGVITNFRVNWGPQFRLGLTGSNVHFPGEENHFLLVLHADLKIDISQNATLFLKYDNESYFKSSHRNGAISGFYLDLFGYRIYYEQIDNFFGTNDSATYFAFAKTWTVWGDWQWDNSLGYLTTNSRQLNSYFDVKTALGKKYHNINIQGGITGTSNPSQFGSIGGPSVFISAQILF